MMASNHSIKALEHIFNAQKSIVKNFHGIVFEQVYNFE